jgi:hypothetical protein
LTLAPRWLYPESRPLPRPAPESVRTHECRDEPLPQYVARAKQPKARQPDRAPRGLRKAQVLELIERLGPLTYHDVAEALEIDGERAMVLLCTLAGEGVIRRLREYKPLRYTTDACKIPPPPVRLRKTYQWERIEQMIARRGSVSCADVVVALGLTRQHAARLLWQMHDRKQVRRKRDDAGRFRYRAA